MTKEEISIFDILSYDMVMGLWPKWRKILNIFNKNFVLYYQYLKPETCDFELFLSYNDALLIRDAKVFRKLDIDIVNGIKEDSTVGELMIIGNLLIFIETAEVIKQVDDQTKNIKTTENKLNNKKFIENVKPEIIEIEKQKLVDFTNLQARRLLNKLFKEFGYDIILLTYKFKTIERIFWAIQYYREINSDIELYSVEWFDYVYSENLTKEEINYLLNS